MNQHVRIRPEIGRAPIIARDFPEGFSLADMVRDVARSQAGALPPEFWRYAVAQVGPDERNIVLPEHWHLVRPRKGTRVNFSLPPGDDDAFNSLLQVTIIGAQLFANLIPGIGPLVSAAIGIGGSFLLAELAPKPKDQRGQGSPKQLGSAGFSNNTLAPYEQLWRVLGRKRVAAPHLAPPYVTVVGEDAFARCVIGLAGRHDISDLKINGADPIGHTLNIRTGLPSDGPLSIYTSVVWQEQGKRLTEYNLVQDVTNDARIQFVNQANPIADMPQSSTFRLGKILPDRLLIDLLWDGGVAQSKTDAKAGVPFELEFHRSDGTRIFLPQLHYLANYRGPLRSKIIIEFSADPGGLTAPNASSPWRQAFAATAGQNTAGTPAHTYYGTGNVASHVGVTSPNIITIYVDPAQVPVQAGDRFWIKRGTAYLPNLMNYTTNVYNSQNALWWTARSSGGGPWQTWEDQAKFYSTCTIEYFSRIWDAEPLDPSGLTTIEMEVRNTQIDSITFVASGYVRWKWDRALGQWTNEPHVSENPAEQVYDILRNTDPILNSRPLATKLIDADSAQFGLGPWAAWCVDNDKTCNMILEGGSVEDAIAPCFQAGHAKLVRSRKWGAWIDRDRSSEPPIKVFGPRDFWNFQIEKTFDRLPHAFRTTFDDRRDDWITVPERLVFADGYDISNATLFEAADYRGITDDYNVDKRARLDLAIMRKRARTLSFECRHRWLTTPRGSLVGVNHPILSSAHVTAGIRSIVYDDPSTKANIMGIILDGEVEMQAGITGIAISGLNAQVFITQSVTPGPTRRVMLSTPLSNDAGIDEGALVSFGTASSKYIRCYVDDIKPGPRGTAKLILVDAADELFGGGAPDDMYQVEDVYDLDDVYSVG
ncbi:MAG: hypothetical protein ACOZAM_15040 [Pseudomonadota bacterium]